MGVISQAMDYYNRERPGVLRQPGRMTAIKTIKRPRQSKPAPTYSVDPVELSRRLSLVLEEQQRCAERRRRASLNTNFASEQYVQQMDVLALKAADPHVTTLQPSEILHSEAKADGHKRRLFQQASVAHTTKKEDAQLGLPYVPREAALQFSVTTTAISMREGTGTSGLVRKLSKSALKFHLGRDDHHKASNARKSEQTQAHGGRIAEEEAECQSHGTRDQQEESRQGSKGVFPERKSEDSNVRDLQVIPDSPDHGGTTSPPLAKPLHISIANEHRVDWTQSDEAKKTRLSPLLRRPISAWTLRGRLGGKEKGPLSGAIGPESPGLKSPKYGFFARFKR